MARLDEVARQVRRLDGYPGYLAGNDVRRFLEQPEPLAAWVAVDHGLIIGHVALHASSSGAVMSFLRASGINPGRVGVVARLLVAPSARRNGTGRRLLDHAAAEAVRRGRTPVLDVVAASAPAIALYDGAGWVRLGHASFTTPDGEVIEEVVYLGPSSA